MTTHTPRDCREALSRARAWELLGQRRRAAWSERPGAPSARTTIVASYFSSAPLAPNPPKTLDPVRFRAAKAIWLFPAKVVFYFQFPTEVVSYYRRSDVRSRLLQCVRRFEIPAGDRTQPAQRLSGLGGTLATPTPVDWLRHAARFSR